MIKYESIKLITIGDWDRLVQETYNKPYTADEQLGWISNSGVINVRIIVPSKPPYPDTLPCTDFNTWLNTDPTLPIGDAIKPLDIRMYWEYAFYPDLYELANDLYNKGLLEEGNYAFSNYVTYYNS